MKTPFLILLLGICATLLGACTAAQDPGPPVLRWYVFDEGSGAFREAARRCSEASNGAYRVEFTPLPADANWQREQLVRRLAARDADIDLIGMDVIWTAEFADAGWILPWPPEAAKAVTEGKLRAPVESVAYRDRIWGAPFTTNAQLLWYRTDRVDTPPRTWDEIIEKAESMGESGTILAQGERYEGLTVFFASLLASAGGSILEEQGGIETPSDPGERGPTKEGPGVTDLDEADSGEDGPDVALPEEPTLEALRIMRRLATSPASDPNLNRAREDDARLTFEAGGASFMVNYTFVWASARRNAPEVAKNMGWARWPGVAAGHPGRVTVGGINLSVGAHSRRPELAFEAATCIASSDNQRLAARRGGLPPTREDLYDEEEMRTIFPFADLLRETLQEAVQRPRTPFYSDVSLAIGHTLHPMAEIRQREDLRRLRDAVSRALRSEGLF